MHSEAKRAINLTFDPTILHEGELILQSNPPKPWTLVCATENRPLSIEIFYLQNRFPLEYIITIVSFRNNAVANNDLLSTYYVFNKILFGYLKVNSHISPEPDVEQRHKFCFRHTLKVNIF